jgi:hypothetical protein
MSRRGSGASARLRAEPAGLRLVELTRNLRVAYIARARAAGHKHATRATPQSVQRVPPAYTSCNTMLLLHSVTTVCRWNGRCCQLFLPRSHRGTTKRRPTSCSLASAARFGHGCASTVLLAARGCRPRAWQADPLPRSRRQGHRRAGGPRQVRPGAADLAAHRLVQGGPLRGPPPHEPRRVPWPCPQSSCGTTTPATSWWCCCHDAPHGARAGSLALGSGLEPAGVSLAWPARQRRPGREPGGGRGVHRPSRGAVYLPWAGELGRGYRYVCCR